MADQKDSAEDNQLKPGVLWHRHGVRLAHHKHSGRLMPWHYTTYAGLYFLLLVTSFVVLFATRAVQAGPPQVAQGDIELSGQVVGIPPTNPALITYPADGQHFNTSLINVSGDCEPNLFVEVYRNGAFAGMDLCDGSGHFEVSLNLVPVVNTLVAKIKNSSGQYGPDSNTVTVFYDVPVSAPGPRGSGASSGGGADSRAPFLIYTDPSVLTASSQNSFSFVYEVDGGLPPYAVAVDWGDGSSPSVASHTEEGDFGATHTYLYGGQFTIRISGSDVDGQKALIQTVVIVQSTDEDTPIISSNCTLLVNCVTPDQWILNLINRFIWPATLAASLMTLSFWLGEKFVYSEWRKAIAGARRF